MGVRFEWDENKGRKNLSKHSISFEEASTVFGDPNSIIITDSVHSESEDRFVILGRSYRGKIMVVVHTERGESIRIISARPATRTESRTYEKSF